MRQSKLSYLALRKGLNTFAYETTFRCSSTSRRAGTRKSRSRTVDLCSNRPAEIYETMRRGRDAFIYPHRGSQHSLGLPLINKTRGFVAPVTRLACEFSKVVNALLNSRLGMHFANSCRNAWRQSASTVTQCTLKVHWRTCASGCSAVGGRSTCVQTVRPRSI